MSPIYFEFLTFETPLTEAFLFFRRVSFQLKKENSPGLELVYSIQGSINQSELQQS